MSEAIPEVWKQVGDDYTAELVAKGCTTQQIMGLSQGAGAFASYLDLKGWTLTPPSDSQPVQ